MSKAPRRAMAALQRLAALGQPDRMAFPALVSLLRELAPFETAAMLWLDADHRPVDSYTNSDASPEHMARYAERWFDREEARFHPTQTQMQLDPEHHVIRVSDFTPQFGETELYDEIYRPAEHHWIAGIALRDGARPIGNLGVARPPRAPDFSAEEMRRLRLARPYVIQALMRARDLESWPEVDAEDEAGLVIVDARGRILHTSPGAWRLLHGAADAPAAPDLLRDRVYAWAQPLLADLAQQVQEGLRGGLSRPARCETVTAYGRFILRAYAFEGDAGAKAPTFGVQIEKRVPAPLRMACSAAFRGLTLREQDIARLLATGCSYPRIATMLDMSPSTVVTHVRSLCRKLGVASREDVVRVLCA